MGIDDVGQTKTHEIGISYTEAQQLIHDDIANESDRAGFNKLSELLSGIYHCRFHHHLKQLKSLYNTFDPDNEIEVERNTDTEPFMELVGRLLADGNFCEISDEKMKRALEEESLFPVSMSVPLDQLSFYKLFYRGESVSEAEIRTMPFFKKKTVKFDVFEKLAFVFQPKYPPDGSKSKRGKKAGKPGKLYLKYFKNIPENDLEMIFPNTKPLMKKLHKLQVFVPLGMGFTITLYKTVIGPFVLGNLSDPFSNGLSLATVAALSGLFAYGIESYRRYKQIHMKFQVQMTDNLYFRNISNNSGVFAALIDEAEEEESKESLLAYYLLRTADSPLTEAELDERVERWLKDKTGKDVDFEVDDALNKLRELGLVKEVDSDRTEAISLSDALQRLDKVWSAIPLEKSA